MALNTYKVLGQESSGTYEKLPVVNRTISSNVATITVGLPQGGSVSGIATGDRVDINAVDQTVLNFRPTVYDAPSGSTFRFPRTNADVTASVQTSAYLYRYSNGLGKTVTNKTKVQGIATLTTGSAHSLDVGDWVSVYINDTNFDGDFVVTAVGGTTQFSYVQMGSDVTPTAVSAGGVAIQKAITLYTAPVSTGSAVISTLAVSNSLTHAAYFTVYIVKAGNSASSPADKTIVSNRTIVNAGETYNMTLGYTLGAGDKVVVRASHAGMYFNLFGSELS